MKPAWLIGFDRAIDLCEQMKAKIKGDSSYMTEEQMIAYSAIQDVQIAIMQKEIEELGKAQ